MSDWPSVPCGASLEHNQIKRAISEACFQAIGAHSGYLLEQKDGKSDFGVDFRLTKLSCRENSDGEKFYCELGSILDFQLKSTTNWDIKENNIVYKLKSKAYNNIVQRNCTGDLPLVLIVMCINKDMQNCLLCDNESINIQHALYWYHTTDTNYLPENSTITIRIPSTQILCKESFDDVVSRLAMKTGQPL